MIANHRIFITGGSGFIGSHLCERLVENNRLVLLDNGHRNALQYSGIKDHPNLQVIRGDVCQPEEVTGAMKGCDMVVHMAAIAGIDSVVSKPIRTMQVNLLGTLNVLEAAAQVKSGLERVVLFSTSEVYGPHVYRATEDSLTTQGPVGEPRWTYAVSKVAAEHFGFCYQDAFQLPVTIIRPFNVYGPRQVGEGAIHKFCVGALRHQELSVSGDGTQIRAWCYVSDFVDGVMAILEQEKAKRQVFNLGNPGQTATILALAERVIRLAQSRSQIVFSRYPMADVEVRVPSIQKARDLLGFNPRVNLEEGIQRTLNWYRDHDA